MLIPDTLGNLWCDDNPGLSGLFEVLYNFNSRVYCRYDFEYQKWYAPCDTLKAAAQANKPWSAATKPIWRYLGTIEGLQNTPWYNQTKENLWFKSNWELKAISVHDVDEFLYGTKKKKEYKWEIKKGVLIHATPQ